MKKNMLTKSVVWVSLILALSVTAFAGPRDHNGGFFLRLSTGFGNAQTEWGTGVDSWKFSGLDGAANIAIGAAVLPNLAVHATAFDWVMLNPTVEIGDISGDFDGTVLLVAYGGGLTYYFMPVNIYLSGSAGVGLVVLSTGGVNSTESELGPAFDVTLGKEWWVGGIWGLGIAATFNYLSASQVDIPDLKWSGYNLALRFTATLN